MTESEQAAVRSCITSLQNLLPADVVGAPSSILGRNWTVMFPFSKARSKGDPENLYIAKAEVDQRTFPYFGPNNGGVFFKCQAAGVHSPNSKYPRCELREMRDEKGNEASWSAASGIHILEVRQAIWHTLVKRPQVVSAQIHNGGDDVMQVALDGNSLVVFWNDKKSMTALDTSYVLGTPFDLKIFVWSGHIKVFYNGAEKVDIAKTGSGWYFKTGCYVQSNVADWNESPDAYGMVEIYSCKVTHTG